MTRLLPISGKLMCKLLERLGFLKMHQKGSHVRYIHPNGRKTVVPVHGNEELSIGILREILRQIELDRTSYEKLRREL